MTNECRTIVDPEFLLTLTAEQCDAIIRALQFRRAFLQIDPSKNGREIETIGSISQPIERELSIDRDLVRIIADFPKSDDLALGLVAIAISLNGCSCPHQRQFEEYRAFHGIDTIKRELGDRIAERELFEHENKEPVTT
jgi:hypothetical protein